MDHNFDIFVKDHLADILCQAEKEQALARLRKARTESHKTDQPKLDPRSIIQPAQLQDCAVSPGFSYNHL